MACESKKISELTRITTLNPGDLIPIVQDGENKAVTVQDLLCQTPKGNCCEDKKTLSEILLAANKALEMARVAWKMSNKAFNEVCSLKEKVNALDVAVSDLQQILCQFENFKNWVINHFDQLERSLAITIEKGTSINGQFTTYTFKQGGVAISPVIQQPRMAPSLNAIYNEWPVTVEQILQLKSDMSQRLYFRAGKFEQNGQYYNGLQEVDAIYIPTRINHLDDGENVITGINVGYNDNKPAQIINNIATIPSFGGYTGNGIPVKLTGGKAYIDPADVEDKLDLNLDDLGDVETPNPHDGDVLYYNGTDWVNVPIATLIAQNLDCEAIKACFSTENFNVAPLVVTLEYNERVANFAVTSSGAWKIQKVTSGDNVFTASIQDNVHQNPGTHSLNISAGSDNTTGQDREVEWDVIPWITVPGLITTQRIKVIQKAQAAPPTPTDRIITYNISGGQTNSIKVNNEIVGNGGQKTAPDGSNYTVPIVSNDPGYRIANVTPSAGTYNNGTLTINPITSDVTVQVVLEEIPAGTHNVTYVVDGDASKITNLPNNPVTVTNGQSYTYTPTIEQGYEIPTNGVTFNPNGNGSCDGTTITIPQGVTTDTTVTIRVVASSSALDVNPDIITVPQGQTTDTNITVSTTCTGGEYNARNLPTGITAVKQTGGFKVTVQSSVSAGQYQFEVYDDCGNTHIITVNVQASWLDNINLGVNGNQFNAFGVIEERFNANSSVAIDPAVSNPYQASTYTNGAATYDVNLGQGPSTDINYLKDHLYLRQQVVTGNEGGTDTSQYRETKLSDFDSSYEQKPSGSNYRYPFTADINLDGNNNVILSIACLPTDFADSDSIVITDTDNSTYSSQEVKGSYVVRALTLELMDDNDNIIDSTPSWDTNFSREIYCNKLFPSKSNNCYGISGYVTSSDTFQITSGYYLNNQDSTSDRTTPLAAWEVSNGKLGHSVVISPTTSSETADIIKTGDVQTLEFTNLQDKQIYDLSVTTNSTNSFDYSSLVSEQLNWIYLSNFVFRMNFSSNISDFVNTSNSWLFTGSIKGRYPTAWGGGNRRSLTYLSVNTSLACEIDPLFSTSQGVDKYSQIVIEDLSTQVASSGISITQIDLLGNIVQGDVIDLTDPNDPHYGDTYDQVINEYCSADQGHGCTSFAIVHINSDNERHISIQFLGVVSDVSVTLNS